MAKRETNVLTEAYLNELYNCAIENDYICGVVVQHMKDEYLPSKDYQMLHNALKQHFSQYKGAPKYGLISQKMSTSRAVTNLLDEIRDTTSNINIDSLRDQFEEFLKLVEFKRLYKLIGEKYNGDDKMSALRLFEEYSIKLQRFTLKPESFVDVVSTFEQRLRENKKRQYEEAANRLVNCFYIDCLDALNRGRNLRKQLTIFLAMSGIGKSHIARYTGSQCAYVGGLNVLHVQAEGGEDEVLDAYSASLVGQSALAFETGDINQHTVEVFVEKAKEYAGSLKVKSFSRFGQKRSTLDIMNLLEDYKKTVGAYPDVVIIDSLDLLNSSTEKTYSKDNLRFQRIAVAEELKDIAMETNCWMVVTYQATIEDKQWVNNEKNVLDGYNLSEAKGIQRPATHLITLNRSDREEEEETMRLYIAKGRFFKKKCKTFRICTDYDHEMFYDRARTLNLAEQEV